jgi:hypothetical protein
MVARFGEHNVFMDVDLEPGVDFVDRITQAVSECHVLIEVIGPTWATIKDAEGEVRLADPEDFVRLELETAMQRPDVTVIPVLVAGAEMPAPRDLPPEVRAITRRNALQLSHERWRSDVGRLIRALERLLAETTASHRTQVPPGTAAASASTVGPGEAPAAPARPADTPSAAPETPAETQPATTTPVETRPTTIRSGRFEALRGGVEGRRRTVLVVLGALAVVAAAVVLGIVALGGGGDGGTPSQLGGSHLDFESFDARAFTVDVPADWKTNYKEQGPNSREELRTKLTDPEGKQSLQIVRNTTDLSAQFRADRAEGARVDDRGYDPIISPPEQTNYPGRQTILYAYRYNNEEGIGPATVYNYFFNDGGFGWETRAAGAEGGNRAAQTRKIARKAARTLKPAGS